MLILAISILLISFLLSVIIRKKYKIPSDFRLYRPVNNTHKWTERILLLLVLFILFLVTFVFPYVETFVILLGYFVMMACLRTFMEYKHEREEKEYFITFIWAISCIIIFIGSIFFTIQTATFSEITNDDESLHPDLVKKIDIENNAWNEDARDLLDKQIKKREISVENNQLINRIFAELSVLELREKRVNNGDRDNYYRLSIRTDRINELTVYDNYLILNSEFYRVVGNNGIYKMLEEEELDWVYLKGETGLKE